MLVRDCMSAHPVTLRPEADLRIALDLMRTHQFHHLPVVDPQGAIVGILAERDLLMAALHYSSGTVDVARVMHRQVVTVTPDTPLREAASTMVRRAIGALPVVSAGRVIGVITETDLFRALVTLLDTPRTTGEHDAPVRGVGRGAIPMDVSAP
jgi:CBS domain-containing protein